MSNHPMPHPKRLLLTCSLVGMLATPALIQAVEGAEKYAMSSSASSSATIAPAGIPPAAAVPLKFNSVTSNRQATQLRRLWGIDDVHVRSTASGSLVRFSYRIVDGDKARLLNSKDATPYLVDEQHGLALQVPVMEQVGQLRQVATPQNGRDYWMAFSNKGRYLTSGNHVTLIVGNLRISGLVVE
jgi:hypothetical protein